ncbi:MAG: 2-dehydropantoate 2-reductase [Clostridiales bacterium]|nr:2-dehydropantoate 2-reductase [Clostridiales bacterium]
MKYVIIGAGGTGGIVGACMTKNRKDVTLIARGRHLEEMRRNGLSVEHLWDGSRESIPVRAFSMEEYEETPDVVLVCVKGYSLQSVVPFIRRISSKDTIVIPILNIYGTGGKLQEVLPELLVTDGCIYVSANIKEPGVLLQHGKICRIVFGTRTKEEYRPALEEIRQDFQDSGIEGTLSDHIQRDALQKFSYVSPIGAAGLYYGAAAGDFQREGAPADMFVAMIREIVALADAMGIHFEQDLVELNQKILSGLPAEATTSMQRDVLAGKESEMDGLITEVVRLGRRYGVPVPEYEKAAEKFGLLEDL